MVVPGPEASASTAGLSMSLDEAREHGFVGRAGELSSFVDALERSCEARVLFVHGPGGIGKTTLLDAFARRARARGRAVLYLDGRDVVCSAAAVLEAVQERSVALDAGATGSGAPPVLLVDGYELFVPLDRWFREQFLLSRSAGTVTVLAGRTAPSPGWRLDPGWRRLVRVHELTELDHRQSVQVLARLGVAGSRRETLAALARGYPLALAMLAEASRGGVAATELADAPDVVAQMCRLIVDDVPDAAHRTGLATCAHATRMTEDLLAQVVGQAAQPVWRWLESRPYVRRGRAGLFVHDVVRELFETEYAQRAPQAYSALHRAVRGYFLERLVDPAEPHPDRAAAEVLLLHRRSPLAAQTSWLRDRGVLSVPRAGPGDHPEVLSLVERAEGPVQAGIARRWIADQPGGLYRTRSDRGIEAFALQVYLPAPADLVALDPVAGAVEDAVARHGPLRPGERINVGRLAGAAGDYQRDPLALLVNGVSCIVEWATRPAAWTFLITSDTAHYGPYFDYLGLRRMIEVRHAGRTDTGYGWDRRRFPVAAFLELMGRRELTGESGPPPADLLRPVPLSRPAFDDAVRQALHQFQRPDRLAGSALLTSALTEPGSPDPVAALRSVLHTVVAELEGERGGAEHRRVLHCTYLKAAPSQEAAAELLGLPFSTYRRHLARATDRLLEVLWAIEIGEARIPPVPP